MRKQRMSGAAAILVGILSSAGSGCRPKPTVVPDVVAAPAVPTPRRTAPAESMRLNGPTPGGSVECPPSATVVCNAGEQPSEAEVRGAMQSLYFHVYKWGASVPSKLRPMPLNRAVCILMRDQSPRHEQRRRLAIMKLTGGLRPLGSTTTPTTTVGPPQFCAALAALNAPLHSILIQIAEIIVRTAQEQRLLLDQIAERVLTDTFGPQNTNCATIVNCSPPQDVDPGANGIGFTISVSRDLSAVKPVMDPQTWADCNSLSFKATYIAAQHTDHSPIIDDITGDAQPAASPPAPGTAYGPLPLFEYFVFDPCASFGGCSSWATSFKNILNITATDQNDSLTKKPQHKIDYGLGQCILSTIVGTVQPKGTGIDIDKGFVKATETATLHVTQLQGSKVIRFTNTGPYNSGINTWTQALLPSLCDEVAGKSGGGVCCDLGP